METKKPTFFNLLGAGIYASLELPVIVAAVFTNHFAPTNLVYFFAALNTLTAAVLMLCSSIVYKSIEPEWRPNWFLKGIRIIDMAGIGLLAAYGWWWSAAALTAGLGAAISIQSDREKKFGK